MKSLADTLDKIMPKAAKEKRTRGKSTDQASPRILHERTEHINRDIKKWRECGRVQAEIVLYDRDGPWLPFVVEVDGEAVDLWTIPRATAEKLGWVKT